MIVPGVAAARLLGGSGAIAAAGIVDVFTNLAYENVAGAGAGIVLSSAGEVLTNNHVIQGATTIHVTDVDNKRTCTASVVGYDMSAGIAVLKLPVRPGVRVDRAPAPRRPPTSVPAS
jgi:S1-C subfamily serine protease